jgi:PAS domain S-box-containing protein
LASARFLQSYVARFLARFLSLSYVKHLIKQYCLSVGLTALLYFLVAKLIFSSLQLGIEPSPVWPPAGIGLFVLLCQGRQVWPGVTLGVLLVGQWLGVSWLSAAGSAFGATLEALLAATMLRWVGFRPSLERLQDALSFIVLAALGAPLLNATFSTGFNLLTEQISRSQAGRVWWTYWLGDSMGILVFTPLLLLLKRQLDRWRNERKTQGRWQVSRLAEKLLCFGGLLGLSMAIFYLRPTAVLLQYPIEYLPFPFVIWAALRFGQTLGIAASFLLSVVAIGGTMAGNGPFAMSTPILRQLIFLQQTFLAVITITGLILATLAAERRRVGALLRQSQASLVKAQQIAKLGNWDFEFKQQQWVWSDELYRLLGLSVRGVAPHPQTLLQVVHPDDREQVEAALEQALTQKRPYRMTYRLLLPDGTERVVEDQVAIGPTHATGILLDITEYKQTEEKLRLTAERNRLLGEMGLRIRQSLDLDEILDRTVQEVRQFLQADRVFICRFDPAGNGRVTAEAVLPGWSSALNETSDASVYPEVQSIFADSHICVVNDTSQEEATPFIRQYHDLYQIKAGIGVALLSATESDQLPLFGLLICHQCARPRQWQPLEIELLEQLGIQVSIAIQQGQLYQQVQQLNNGLEQQVAERTAQLETNLAKLGEMNQLQDVFLHAIAHDLRTTVMGTLMLLKNFQQQPGDQISIPRKTLERMIESGELQRCKLDSLVEAYTNKLEGVTLDLKSVNLSPLLNQVLAQLQPLFLQNQATVETELADLPPIEADPTQLERVFSHLLVNAVKHNPPGVQVRLRARVDADWLYLTVTDSGRGIDPEQQERIFELKTGEGRHRQLTGIGVGLCLCQQIISAHGGKISVQSQMGQGSKFQVRLPRRQELS